MTITYQLAEINTVAEQVWQEGKEYKVWAFYASMGSGKTTFISALCSFLAVEDVISSPTYAIVNEYYSPIAGTIYHMDWYRFNSLYDAISSGVEELLNDGLCLIEWPEKAPSLLPENIFSITISLETNGARKLTTAII